MNFPWRICLSARIWSLNLGHFVRVCAGQRSRTLPLALPIWRATLLAVGHNLGKVESHVLWGGASWSEESSLIGMIRVVIEVMLKSELFAHFFPATVRGAQFCWPGCWRSIWWKHWLLIFNRIICCLFLWWSTKTPNTLVIFLLLPGFCWVPIRQATRWCLSIQALGCILGLWGLGVESRTSVSEVRWFSWWDGLDLVWKRFPLLEL